MSLLEKAFQREVTLRAPGPIVLEATREYAIRMVGWDVEDAAPGATSVELSKYSERLRFDVSQTSGGTQVSANLVVPRASTTGFMLFDVGNYYGRTLDKHLHGIWQVLGEMYATSPWEAGHDADPPEAIAPPRFSVGESVVVIDAEQRPWRGTVVQMAQGKLEVRYEDGSQRWVAAHDAHTPTA
jgi:hypothetical protein